MSSDNANQVKIRGKFNRKFILITGLVLGLSIFLFWAFHGTITTITRYIVASMSFKLFVVASVICVVSLIFMFTAGPRRSSEVSYYYRSSRSEKDDSDSQKKFDTVYRVSLVGLISGIVLLVLSTVVLPFVGGFLRAQPLVNSVVVTNETQPSYKWRTPWIVAAAAAPSRSGDVVGDFIIPDTTFLPGIGKYSTPVKARGFAAGLGTVIEQDPATPVSSSCEFESQPPVHGGWFGANLNRAISFIDSGLHYSKDDAWVYCDDAVAKLVVPVYKMIGQPESSPVPAGVIIYNGNSASLLENVKPGELPGPVYPSYIAEAQRLSLTSSQGFVDKIMSRAGFETSDDTDGDPNNGNVSELLLESLDGGWDYVTPLTPRGKSFTVTAVSVVPADRVTAGELNTMVVYKLPSAREGNLALNDKVLATFRSRLAGSAGLQLVEIIPTSPTSWEGTITNGRAVVNRVSINTDGSLCLLSSLGKTLECVDGSGVSENPLSGDFDETTVMNEQFSDLSSLSDAELAELSLKIAQEQLNRATSIVE